MVSRESRYRSACTSLGTGARSLPRPSIGLSQLKVCFTPARWVGSVGPSVTRKTSSTQPIRLVITSQNWRQPVRIHRDCSTFASANFRTGFDGDDLTVNNDGSPTWPLNAGEDTGETRKSSWKDEHNIASAPISNTSDADPDNDRNPKPGWPVDLDFEDIVSVPRLKAAWVSIRSKPGNLTPGSGRETLDRIDQAWFEETSEKLIRGTFIYPTKRRKAIPKPGKKGTRPLTLINPRVKIIERAILNALEPHFEGAYVWQAIDPSHYDALKNDRTYPNNELKRSKGVAYKKRWVILPIFQKSSHGFRPNHSCHSALECVDQWRPNTVWLLDYDIRKAFDNVNRNRLENIFKSYIRCDRLWAEIRKMMNAGIVDPSAPERGFTSEDATGTPQGSVLSPSLFNLYMTPFDNFITDQKRNFHQAEVSFSGDKAGWSAYKKYTRVASSSNIGRLFNKLGSVEAVAATLRKEKRDYYRVYPRSEGKTMSPRFIQYVRYADDFILGIGGSKRDAMSIRDQIDTYLKSNLHLTVSTNRVINRNEGPAQFLGFIIQLSKFKAKTRKQWNRFASIAKYKNRVINRLKISDTRLANAAVQNVKRNLMRIFRRKLEAKGRSLRKEDYRQIPLVIADELSKTPKENPALLRWEMHFADLFDANRTLALRQYHRQLSALAAPDGDNEFHLALIELRNKFIDDIDVLIQRARNSYADDRYDKLMKAQAKLSAEGKKEKPLNESTARKLAAVLNGITLESKSATAISVRAPLRDLTQGLVMKNFLHAKRLKPIGNNRITYLSDPEIIAYYSSVMYGMLNYYRPAHNFYGIRSLAESLRRSCHLTLAIKHKKSYAWAVKVYGPECKTEIYGKTTQLPPISKLANMDAEFKASKPSERFNLDHMEKKFFRRLAMGGLFFKRCAVNGCLNTDIEVHHIRKLGRRVAKDGQMTVLNRSGRRVRGKTALLSALNRKQIPLCRAHYNDFEAGIYADLDTTYLTELYNTPIPDDTTLRDVFLRGAMEFDTHVKADPKSNRGNKPTNI